jgi:hypothetical protein
LWYPGLSRFRWSHGTALPEGFPLVYEGLSVFLAQIAVAAEQSSLHPAEATAETATEQGHVSAYTSGHPSLYPPISPPGPAPICQHVCHPLPPSSRPTIISCPILHSLGPIISGAHRPIIAAAQQPGRVQTKALRRGGGHEAGVGRRALLTCAKGGNLEGGVHRWGVLGKSC